MPYDLTSFSLTDVLRIGPVLRDVARDADSMQTAAERVVQFLYRECVDPTDAKACALVRFYKTHPYEGLSRSLQHFAQRALGTDTPKPSMKCLTLLATTGDRPEWTSPRRSRQHQAIPLASEKIVEQAPMISQLLKQFGLPVKDLIAPSPEVLSQDLAEKTYNVFHVENALGSPFIPAQEEFVKPYEIRSVLGFGGTLRSGDLFAVIMFSRAHIPPASASRFRTVALDVKASIFGMDGNRVFSRPAGADR
jgi:hypothetical protein